MSTPQEAGIVNVSEAMEPANYLSESAAIHIGECRSCPCHRSASVMAVRPSAYRWGYSSASGLVAATPIAHRLHAWKKSTPAGGIAVLASRGLRVLIDLLLGKPCQRLIRLHFLGEGFIQQLHRFLEVEFRRPCF